MVASIKTKTKVIKKVVKATSPKKTTKLTAVKKSVKKVVVKKTLDKKTRTKKAVSFEKKKPLAKKKPVTEEVVVIPAAPSLRLLEKVELYKIWYKENLPEYVEKTARIGGYSFVFLGTLLTVFSYGFHNNYFDLPAAAVCSENNCVEIANTALPVGAPVITFLNSASLDTSTNFKVLLKTENANNFDLFIVSAVTGKKSLLDMSQGLVAGERSAMVDLDNLDSGHYDIVAEARVEFTTYKFKGPSFSVEGSQVASVIMEDLLETNSTSTKTEELAMAPEVSQVTEATTTDVVEEEIGIIVNNNAPISLQLNKTEDSEFLKIKTGTFVPREVEIYSRYPNSPDPYFLGLATLVQGDWIFSLSALDIPAVDQLLYSSFIADGTVYNSEGLSYLPDSRIIEQSTDVIDSNILVEKVNLALAQVQFDYKTRSKYFSAASDTDSLLFDSVEESKIGSAEIIEILDVAMKSQADNLDILLLHYASALVTNNNYSLALINNQIKLYSEKLSLAVATELKDNSQIPTLNTILSLRFAALKKRVELLEANFIDIAPQFIKKDTDSDSISDYDEKTYYGTESTIFDPDDDGVSDGIEILKDFNPLIADVKQTTKIHQNFADNTFTELVKINSVRPLVIKNQNNSSEQVFAIIDGKALPNAYVAIVALNNSTVGLIKTNNQGNFNYTLEKSIQNGEQEFLAVLVDNEGTSVASSEVYRFVKSSNQFVAAAVNTTPAFNTQEDIELRQSGNVIAAIGVLSFGFILLLLSQIGRQKKFNIEETPVAV